eukprot:870130_1
MDQTNEVSFIVLHDSYLVVIRFMFDHSVVKQMSFTNYFYQLLLPNTFTNYFYQILLPTTFTNYFYQHSLTNEFDQKRKSTRTQRCDIGSRYRIGCVHCVDSIGLVFHI